MNENLVSYINANLIAKRMLKQGIIDEDDYKKIDDNLKKKYCINNNNLYLQIDLIYTLFRANM